MNETMETILLEALDLLEQGLGVEEITARYPAQAAELRPFLLTAVALSRLATQPAAAAETRSKRAFLAAAGRAAQQPRALGVAGLWRRLALPVVALVAVLFLGAAGLVRASSSAMPGDALYGAKLFVERARLGLVTDPERAADLREQFGRERRSEIEYLLSTGQTANVEWTGPIEVMDGALWRIGGLPARVSAATVIDGTPAVGSLVTATGWTAGDAVALLEVTVLSGVTPLPTPPAEPIDDRAPDDEEITSPPGSRPAATGVAATPTATATATATATISPSPTAPPAPTETLPPPPGAAPTATPDDDNGNDNDDDNDDNANDNDNDDDNANDNDDDNANDNDDDNDDDNANANDDDDDDNANGNDDNSGSGGGDDDNDNGGGDDDDDDANDNDDDDDDNGGGDDEQND